MLLLLVKVLFLVLVSLGRMLPAASAHPLRLGWRVRVQGLPRRLLVLEIRLLLGPARGRLVLICVAVGRKHLVDGNRVLMLDGTRMEIVEQVGLMGLLMYSTATVRLLLVVRVVLLLLRADRTRV
jgi:hypothetical protein